MATNSDKAAVRYDVERLIDERPLSSTQWTVFALCALVMFVDGFDLQALSLVVPYIARDWAIEPPAFSFALSASLVGMGIGGGLFAPLGDRIGRKPMLVAALALVGSSTLAIAFAAATWHITALRLVTGIGMGMAAVNSLSLTGEFAPASKRVLIMSLMASTIALGAFASAMAAPTLILGHGWHMLFVVGGLATLGLGLCFALFCAESIKWLLASRPADRRTARTARRLFRDLDPTALSIEAGRGDNRKSVFALLAPQHRVRTLVIWLANASGGFSLYLTMSWLPTLLIGAGWSASAASYGAAAIQLGGILGSLTMSYAVDRGRFFAALLVGYSGALASLLGVAFLPADVVLWTTLFVLIGAGTAGMQVIWIAMSVVTFPLDLRSTSAGWTSAVSRLGAVSAPFAGGAALAAGLGASQMMLGLVIPVGASAAALILSRRHFAIVREQE